MKTIKLNGRNFKVLVKAEDWWHVVDEKGNDFWIRPPNFPALQEEIKDSSKVRELLIASNVPELFIEEILEGKIKKTQAIEFLIEKRKKLLSGKWAYLWGKPGTGKTFACVYFLYRYAKKYGRAGYFIFCPSHDFKEEVFKREIKEQADIFILDDLILELPHYQLQEVILFLLETYNRPRKTVLITSNVSLKDLLNHIKDERLASRLLQKLRGCVLKVEGEDMRLRK